MCDHDKADLLLDLLKADSAEYKKIRTAGCSLADRKNAIRSFMNIRMPGPAPQELLRAQDDYLQEELAEKGIVSLNDIATVSEQCAALAAWEDHISLWQGDITRLAVGAVVNAANSRMLGCFIPCHRCIDNAIHSAAGIQLRMECDRIMHDRKMRFGEAYEEPVGTAVLTAGYNLPCDYVIHTVGPIVTGGLHEGLRQDLRRCYESVLQCCVEHEIRSVAFCCISTGEFRFPADEAAQIAVRTVRDFLCAHEGALERIIFNVFKDSDLEIYRQILGISV